MRNAIPLALLAAVSLAVSAPTAQACSCAKNPSADDLFMSSEAVFTGTVRMVERLPSGRLATTFYVTEPFKGVARGALVKVEHGSSAPACGVTFERDYSYTLAAARRSGVLMTGQCQTWMFLPQVGVSKELIERLRTLRR